MNSSDWASKEFDGIDLGDNRLSKRLVKIVDKFTRCTESPINQVCETWSQAKAAYRFFQNENVDYKKIVAHHAKATQKRFEDENVVLAIQDTTYFNYSDHPKTKGLGLLSRFTGKYKKDIMTSGLYMHSTLAINTDGLPLGLVDQKISSREVADNRPTGEIRSSFNRKLTTEEKESVRWLDAMRSSVNLFKDKTVVTIADREADIYDLFLLGEELKTHYLVRASHDRRINKNTIHSEKSGTKLRDFMKSRKYIGNIDIEVPAKKNKPKRIAKCGIKVGTIKLLAPRNLKKGTTEHRELTLYSVQVVEKNPPKGFVKLDWILHTNIPVKCYEEALEKVKWYCLRWRIEVYFKVIKSGFNVEDCRLETADRLIRYLAVVSIVACRVFWLTMASRATPNLAATVILTEIEWKALYFRFNPGKQRPKKIPSIKQVTIWIARLGGFMARKHDGIPGITHIWRGIEKLADIIRGVELYSKIYG